MKDDKLFSKLINLHKHSSSWCSLVTDLVILDLALSRELGDCVTPEDLECFTGFHEASNELTPMSVFPKELMNFKFICQHCGKENIEELCLWNLHDSFHLPWKLECSHCGKEYPKNDEAEEINTEEEHEEDS